MSDYPPVYPPPPAVVNDFSQGPTAEHVAQQQPPPYGFINPSASTDPSNTDVKPTQYQPPWGQPTNMVSPGNAYPGSVVINPELNSIEDYQVWSILNIICCCWFIGCFACYFSLETNNNKQRGDIQGALNASRTARTINIISTVLGIIIQFNLILLYIGAY
jgi:hypothetical protein